MAPDTYDDEDLAMPPTGCSGHAYCLNEHDCPEIPQDPELAEEYWRGRIAWLRETFDLPSTEDRGA